MENQEIVAALDRIIKEVESLKSTIISDSKIKQAVTENIKPSKKRTPKIQVAESLPANQLGPTPDYENKAWPQAVSPYMNVTDRGEADKIYRAVQIVNFLDFSIAESMKVLDIGCGEGHVAKEYSTKTKTIGYDVKFHDSWSSKAAGNNACVFTDDKHVVVENGKYDLIVLYDVLDHLVGQDPITFMSWVKGLLNTGGTVFVRTHPWTSKHGGHLYETKINKAFIHLALTTDEMTQAGWTLPPNLKIVRPLAAYEHIFKDSGFQIADRKNFSEPVEPFFTDDLLDRIINVTWSGKIDRPSALKVMASQFIDFRLSI